MVSITFTMISLYAYQYCVAAWWCWCCCNWVLVLVWCAGVSVIYCCSGVAVSAWVVSVLGGDVMACHLLMHYCAAVGILVMTHHYIRSLIIIHVYFIIYWPRPPSMCVITCFVCDIIYIYIYTQCKCALYYISVIWGLHISISQGGRLSMLSVLE